METTDRSFITNIVTVTAGQAAANEVNLILDDLYAASEQLTFPAARLELMTAESQLDRVIQEERFRQKAAEALRQIAERPDAPAPAAILLHKDSAEDYVLTDIFTGTIIKVPPELLETDVDEEVRNAVNDGLARPLRAAIENSFRSLMETEAIFAYTLQIIYAFVAYAVAGRQDMMARIAPLLHCLPHGAPVARTLSGEILFRLGDSIMARISPAPPPLPQDDESFDIDFDDDLPTIKGISIPLYTSSHDPGVIERLFDDITPTVLTPSPITLSK